MTDSELERLELHHARTERGVHEFLLKRPDMIQHGQQMFHTLDRVKAVLDQIRAHRANRKQS